MLEYFYHHLSDNVDLQDNVVHLSVYYVDLSDNIVLLSNNKKFVKGNRKNAFKPKLCHLHNDIMT